MIKLIYPDCYYNNMRAVLLLALVLLISGVAIAPALAGVTKQIAVQGMLTKGSIIFGTTVKFDIFNNSGGTGSPICTVTKNDIAAATNGIFTTLLDLSSCTTLDFSTDYWIKITIGTGAGSELGPLQRLTPAPYALALPGLVSKDGKIGIGMAEPISKLQIYDGENAEIFSGSPVRAGFMAVGGPGTVALYSNEAGQQLSILSNAAGAYWELGLHETIPDFAIWDTDAPRFVIQNNTGNVGIGTTIPQAKLDVNGDIRINNAPLSIAGSGGSWRILQGALALGAPLQIQSVALGEEESPVTAITFARDGNVGIGTMEPSAKLEVIGTVKIVSLANLGEDAHSEWTGAAVVDTDTCDSDTVTEYSTTCPVDLQMECQDVKTNSSGSFKRNITCAIGRRTVIIDENSNVNITGRYYGEGAIPSGMIAMFDAACPSNWTRFTALDGKFARGADTYGGTGGLAEHSHTVDPPATNSGGMLGYVYAAKNVGGAPIGSHQHNVDIAEFLSGSASSLPPYVDVVWCKKD